MSDPRIEAAAVALLSFETSTPLDDVPGPVGRDVYRRATAALAAADKAATITTVEELATIPDDSIVRTAEGRTGQVYTYRNGSRMLGFTSSLHAPASLGLVRHLPARVIHRGNE